MISRWQLLLALLAAVFILGGIISLSVYIRYLQPRFEPQEVEFQIIPDMIVIRESETQQADSLISVSPEVNRGDSLDYDSKLENNRIYLTTFEIRRDRYQGDLRIEFDSGRKTFSHDLQLVVQPDTIFLTRELLLPGKTSGSDKIKLLYVYLGGGVAFSPLDSGELKISGGSVDLGLAIKKTWLIYGSVDIDKKLWLKTGILL